MPEHDNFTNEKRKTALAYGLSGFFYVAAELGFEPRQTDPESGRCFLSILFGDCRSPVISGVMGRSLALPWRCKAGLCENKPQMNHNRTTAGRRIFHL